jgi:Heparinase II/III N-terminus/Heparinase II/III-like protein
VSPSPWIAFKALRQLGVQPVMLNAIYRLGLATGHYRRVEKKEQREQREESSNQGGENRILRGFFVLPKPEELLAVIGNEGKAAILAEADEIVGGKVRLFGGEPVELILTVPGKLEHWTTYETGKADLRPLTPDIKKLWEPARFGWVFCLGRAYHLTRDDKYAKVFWDNFETFTTANPAYFGPNWVSGQEIALRLMAFVWAGQVFSGCSSSTPGRSAALAEAVKVHALRIPPTLVYARSQQNNHLLTEAAGLLTAGLALPGHPKASRWCVLGWKLLNQGLQSQIDSSGEYAQHSTNYHRLMLQVVLWVDVLMRSNDLSRYYWPNRTIEAILRCIDWLLDILDPDSGRVPNLGANDGAYIFPLSACPFSDFRPVVHAVARVFLNSDLPRGPWDDLAVWFGLPLEGRKYDLRKHSPARINGKGSWAYLRTAQFTTRPSHADQLHVDLWWHSLNIALDAGSYLYNADPPWDNSLTTALVHNTVTVNNLDQFTRAGRFLYLDWFNAYRRSSIEADPAMLENICGWHWGYRKQGIRHERTVTAYADGHWQVRDDLLQIRKRRYKKPLTFRLHWLLPDWEWQVEGSQPGMSLRLKSPHGPVGLHVNVTGGATAHVDLIRAGEAVFMSSLGSQKPIYETTICGWASPTYGVKVPALSLAVETQSANDVQFISEFYFPK